MSMFGWLDIKQAERYTREADRKRLGRENAHLLGTNGVGKIPHLGPSNMPVRENETKKARIINGRLYGWCPRRASNISAAPMGYAFSPVEFPTVSLAISPTTFSPFGLKAQY
jgi:hypothetical protein